MRAVKKSKSQSRKTMESGVFRGFFIRLNKDPPDCDAVFIINSKFD
ncbi:hypothetical protein RB2083_1484 [Rhodobacteraceae bacterium HTCC2083]|nr:hypothetical protein RB2083_1484 [Rhodobacteraceae bacterium HTCC2083]